MLLFEENIAQLGKWHLKKFLQKNTDNRFKSIITGFLQTFIFQSSTIVTMLTIWFVGAGIIGLANALGVVVGANIGTTLTPWLITLFGFKFSAEVLALPIIGVWGIIILLSGHNAKAIQIAKFLIGFWLLFLGLEYMKDSVWTLAESISLTQYSHFSIRWYALIGAIITTIMQTSTGVIIIILTALNAGLITLDMALWLVIGANLGSSISTTVMWLLGTTSQQGAKRKVAISHLIFNVSTTLVVILLYPYLKNLVLLVLGSRSEDGLFILSGFHTLFNLILAIVWTPLLWALLRFLHKIFPPKKSDLQLAIHSVNTPLAEEMLAALEKDTRRMLQEVEEYNREVLYIDHYNAHETHKDYITIKEIEWELLNYIVKLNKGELTELQARRIHALNDVIMHAILSSKNLKDVQHHIINLKDESITNSIAGDSLLSFQDLMEKTSNHIDEINKHGEADGNIALLETALEVIEASDDEILETLSAKASDTDTDTRLLPEILKTNRYVLLSCQELVKGYMAYLGDGDEK